MIISNKNYMYLLGKDIAHSKSPMFFNNYFKEHNINMEYKLYDTDNIENFIKITKTYPVFAFNVTMPYKKAIIKYLDEYDEIVKNSCSCNFVKIIDGKYIGYSTDGIGFFESLKNEGVESKNITIIGYGGAGKSIYYTSKYYNIKTCEIIDKRTAKDIINNKKIYNEVLSKLSKSDLIINASNVGFGKNDDMPLPKKILEEVTNINSDFTFVDIIYNPIETQMLKFMKNAGVKRVYNGEGMLKYQFLENIKILFR